MPNNDVDYGQATIPPGIRSRYLDDVNGLRVHILEAGDPSNPCVLFLHGFPELAYSWRKILLPIADLGYHVVAPDQRGYGLTTGWDPYYDGDLASYRMLNLVRDAVDILVASGHGSAAAIVGHDFGSPVAAWSSLIRPDLFRAVVLMSSPFAGTASLSRSASSALSMTAMDANLARLAVPRKHYQYYYSTREANRDMQDTPHGIHAFLRAYYHVKSADWAQNDPHPLASWSADAIAELPHYYVMDRGATMPESVADHVSEPESEWLTDDELGVYSESYQQNGFHGGLQWYRCATDPKHANCLKVFAGRTIDIPAAFIAGKKDWGTYQKPGSFEKMQTDACTDFRGVHLVDGAGHWVQQEQPQAVIDALAQFLKAKQR